MRFVAAIGLVLGGLLAAGTAFASDDAGCQRPETSAQECVAKLAPTPAVSIGSVEGGAAGGNKTYAGRLDMMRQGANRGMARNTAVGEAGIVVGLVVAPNCAPPNCVGLAVQVAAAPAGPAPIPIPYPVAPAVPGAAVSKPSPACTGNPAQAADCQAKLAAYQGYMANLSRDVPLSSLPALYVELLKPLYPHVDLRTVQFGFSSRQQPKNATTDCSRIYFNGEDYVRKLAAGTLRNDERENPLWLYHELRHTEQCVEWGGRDFFVARWFKDFQIGLIQTRLQRDPQAFMKEAHDSQPMDGDANARMRQVEKALPNGLVAPGRAGRR